MEKTMLLDISKKKPEGEWTSYNESCGVGDGKETRFLIPFPIADARELLVLRNRELISPDRRLLDRAKDGKILSKEADGYSIDGNHIVFEQPVTLGLSVSVCSLGRRVGDAFKILPLTSPLQKSIEGKVKETKELERGEALNRRAFMDLLVDWDGLVDAVGNPVPCNDETKAALLDSEDPLYAIYLCNFVYDRSRAIQRERTTNLKADGKNS